MTAVYSYGCTYTLYKIYGYTKDEMIVKHIKTINSNANSNFLEKILNRYKSIIKSIFLDDCVYKLNYLLSSYSLDGTYVMDFDVPSRDIHYKFIITYDLLEEIYVEIDEESLIHGDDPFYSKYKRIILK